MRRASERDPWLLLVLSCAFGSVAFDNSKLVSSLPSLIARYHPTPLLLSALGEANIAVYASLLLIGGALCTRFGARRMLLIGLSSFGLASLAGALAGSAGSLLLSRACVGASAASITPATLAVIKQAFAESARPRAVAIWTSSFGLGAVLGPIVGGALLSHVGIAAALGSNLLPISLCAWGAWRFVPAGPPRAMRGSPERTPLVDLGLLADPRIARALLVIVLSYFAFAGASVVVPQYLQLGRAISPLESGLRTAPLAGSLLLGTLFSSRLIAGWAANPALRSNLTLAATGAVLLALASSSQNCLTVSLALVPFGLGAGGTFACSTELVLASVRVERAASAAALSESAFELGGALGVAVLGAITNAADGPARVLAASPRALWVGALSLCAARAAVGVGGGARHKPASA